MFSVRRSVIYGIASAIALVAVIVAIRVELLPHRLWPVAVFLTLWLVAASYLLIAAAALGRRAARLKAATVQRGVRLVRPRWIPFMHTFDMLLSAAMLSAVAAAVGFPAVGVGIVLLFAAIGILLAKLPLDPAELTFEADGLRVYGRNARLLIRWSAIADVAVGGPPHDPSTKIRLSSPEQVLATVEPDTPGNRHRVELWMAVGGNRTFSFSSWTGGLDSVALARTIRDSLDGHPAQLN